MRPVRIGLAVGLLWISLLQNASSYRILGLFAHPGLSHFKVFQPIMRGLAEVGHHVTVVSYFPNTADPHPNYVDYAFQGQDILTNAFSLEVSFGGFFMI